MYIRESKKKRKHKYRIFITIVLIAMIVIGYKIFLEDHLKTMDHLKTEMMLDLEREAIASDKISKIPEYNTLIKELNEDVRKLKTDFSNKSSQEDMIRILEKSKKENNELAMTYKIEGTQINPIQGYLEGTLDDDLKGYVIEHNLTLDIKGECSKLYDFLNKLHQDASIRINNTSMHTNKESGLLYCTLKITCVGVVMLV